MSTFTATYPEFKQLTSELLRSLPTAKTVESVQGGVKCLTIAYFNLQATPDEAHQAYLLLEIAQRKANQRELDILFEGLRGAPTDTPALSTASP